MTKFMDFLSRLRSNQTNLIPRLPYRDDSIFGLLFFLFTFVPLIFISVIDEGFETPKMAFFLLVLGGLIAVFVYKRLAINQLPKYLQMSFLVFFVSIIVSTIFSLDVRNSLFGLMGRPSNSALFLVGWLIVIYILHSNLDLKKSLTLTRSVVFTGIAIAVYSLLQQEGIGYYEGVEAGVRAWAPSFLGNPNFNSMYLAMVVPLALYCFDIAKRLSWKAFYAVSSFLMIWVIAQSASRAAILGIISALIVLAGGLVLRRKFGSLLLMTCVAIVSAGVMSYAALNVYRPDSIGQSIQFQEANQQSRLVIWDMTTQMIQEDPWIGTGLSNYFIKFNSMGWSTLSYGERFDDPHNVFLLLGVNGGIIMLLSFLVILGLTYYRGWKSSSESVYPLVWLAGISAWIVAGSFGPIVLACWLLLGLAIAVIFLEVQPNKIVITNNLYRYGGLAVGVICSLLGILLISSYVFLYFSKLSYEVKDYERSLQMANYGQFWGAANSRVSYYQLRSMIRLNHPAEETEAVLLRDIKRKPNAAGSYVSAATIYYHLWKQTADVQYLGKMENMMNEALIREPNYANSYLKFAYLYMSAGNLEKALEYQRLSLTYSGDQFYSWVLLSKIYYDLNMRDQFLFAYEKASVMNEESFLIKGTLRAFKDTADIQSFPYPVYFPEPE